MTAGYNYPNTDEYYFEVFAPVFIGSNRYGLQTQ